MRPVGDPPVWQGDLARSARRCSDVMDIVTVFSRRDLGQMVLQARSIRLYFDRQALGQVIYVCNEPVAPIDDGELQPIFDELPDAVLVRSEEFIQRRGGPLVSQAQLAQIPYSTEGWFTQQVLKIVVAELVQSDHYLILNAKNHFVRDVQRRAFVADDGRPLAAFGALSRIHKPFHPMWRNCYDYVGLDPNLYENDTIRPVTPFVTRKDTTCDLIEYVERREQGKFADAFIPMMPKLLEFFLIQAFTVYSHGSLDRVYRNAPQSFESIFHPTILDERKFNAAMNRAEGDDINTFGVHWAAEILMSAEQRQRIVAYWQRRGLIESPEEASRILGWQ